MEIKKFDEYSKLFEGKIQEFDGSLKFNDWSDFKSKIQNALNVGFSDIKELLNLLGMDFQQYEKIKTNMIMNWKDSVTKSLLHSISNLNTEFPEKGEQIFTDIYAQTRFLIISSNGYSSNDIYGDINRTHGLNIISSLKLDKIKNTDPTKTTYNQYTRKDEMDKFVKLGDTYAYTASDEKTLDLVNMIIQYVWVYVFYNKHLLKTGIQNKSIKLPKYLYRGIRFGNLYKYFNTKYSKEFNEIYKKYKDVKGGHIHQTKEKMDIGIKHIISNGISDVIDGNFLSFTASVNIAKYFSNKDGIIIRVDSSKVDIITSELTDDLFDVADYVSNKKEREYIVRIPSDYKFNEDDIIISDTDYLIASNNPLSVEYFDHDDKHAEYDYNHNGKKYHIHAYGYWVSNSNFTIGYVITDEKGNDSWTMSKNQVIKEYGFNPLPSENNLKNITNFKSYIKSRW